MRSGFTKQRFLRRMGCLLRQALLGWVYVALALGSVAWAGSYEDYFRAIGIDDESTVRELLERGFDPNTVDAMGHNGLILAFRGSAAKVAEVLLTWPTVRVDQRNAKDETALMYAAMQGNVAWCATLLARGAAVHKPGWTPLHYAATRGHVDVIRLLLSEGARINAVSPNGTTPLMMAAYYGTTDAVRALLAAGAKVAMRNEQGLDAHDFAERAGNRASMALLRPGRASVGGN
ncbi:ankyrin repeat domain-containing protein [Candidatus Symbiobacter mobilis]|nr:ankyrin repeat domain-containing protein [Candidatus Symbiobacter mobilis]